MKRKNVKKHLYHYWVHRKSDKKSVQNGRVWSTSIDSVMRLARKKYPKSHYSVKVKRLAD